MTDAGNGAGQPSVARVVGLADTAIFVVRSNPACREGCDSIRMLCEQRLGCTMHFGQQIDITRQIRHTHPSKAGLSSPEQFAGTAQLEVPLRDVKAVVAVANSVQPSTRQGAERRPVEQNATALV